VIDVLSDLFILRGVSGHIRSDNGPEVFVPRYSHSGVEGFSARTFQPDRQLLVGIEPPEA
jgi:hypothetical protein